VRRFLKGSGDLLADLTAAAVKGWNDFFFAAADPTPLGLIRIAAGLSRSGASSSSAGPARLFRSTAGLTRARSGLGRPLSWSFWFVVPERMAWAVWIVCLAICFSSRGTLQPVTAVLSWVIVCRPSIGCRSRGLASDQVLSAYAPVPGRDGRERPGSVSRPVPAALGQARPAPPSAGPLATRTAPGRR